MATQNQNRIVDSDRLFVRITRDGQRLMLAVHGEIDLANAGLLYAELERAEETDAEEIVLDLSGVEFIDSTGLQVLVVAGRRSELDSNRLGVRRGTGEVARLMSEHRVSGLPVTDKAGRVLGVVSEADLMVKEQGPDAIHRRPMARLLGESRATRLNWPGSQRAPLARR